MFIVIVNWNLKDDTANCIRSLVQAGAYLEKIIVVDNGSIDGSGIYLRETFGDLLRILKLNENKGFAAATNLGIYLAIQQNAEWIFLINNDAWVAIDFFENLFEVVNTQPKCLIFGPAIYFAGDSDVIWFLGDRLIPGTMLTANRFRGKALPQNLPKMLPVDFLNGCGMLVNRKAFEDTGLFDTGLFMYGEEVDWCWRARRAGHRLAAIPAATMWHKVSASSNRISTKTRYLRIRNQAWVYRRYGNMIQKFLLVAFTFLRVFWMSLRDSISGHRELWQPTWHGWLDGWQQNLPPVNEYVQQ